MKASVLLFFISVSALASPLGPSMTGKCDSDLSVELYPSGQHVLKYKEKKCAFSIDAKRSNPRSASASSTLYFDLESCDGKKVTLDSDESPLRKSGFIKIHTLQPNASGILRALQNAQPVVCSFNITNKDFLKN